MFEITPIQTKRFQPPQENIFPELVRTLQPVLHDGDVLVVTSKIVSIHEGSCIPVADVPDKEALVSEESDWYLPAGENNTWSVSFKHGTLLFAAGIDASNADDHYILLPEDPVRSAADIRAALRTTFGLRDLGVIIVDSHVLPFRKGSVGVALGSAGIRPVVGFEGTKDLFGRPFAHTRINVVDSLATTAVYAMGETIERTPLCLIRNAPHVELTDEDCADDVRIAPQDDMYYPLIQDIHGPR